MKSKCKHIPFQMIACMPFNRTPFFSRKSNFSRIPKFLPVSVFLQMCCIWNSIIINTVTTVSIYTFNRKIRANWMTHRVCGSVARRPCVCAPRADVSFKIQLISFELPKKGSINSKNFIKTFSITATAPGTHARRASHERRNPFLIQTSRRNRKGCCSVIGNCEHIQYRKLCKRCNRNSHMGVPVRPSGSFISFLTNFWKKKILSIWLINRNSIQIATEG